MQFKELVKKFIPSFLLSLYHFLLAAMAALIYRFPARHLRVIGVTGTNGKTTTVHLISEILRREGYRVASLSSISFRINENEWPNLLKMTLPGRFQVQKFLREAVRQGCEYAVLEVTSQGIVQHRHRFIRFATAVLTNLTPEHIEAHRGFANYRAAKAKLFQATKGIHVINLDDENADYFLQFAAERKYTYGWENGDFNQKNLQLKLLLPGSFNVYNALAAVAVAAAEGIDLMRARRIVEGVKGLPGRMEEVISEPFRVVVDYAFTPAALEKVYQALVQSFKLSTTRSLICVLGACGGGRDKWKRPVLGEIAGKYCREIIITNEDPYDEDPRQILSQIKSGIIKSQFPISSFHEILDRREAIQKALDLAQKNDIVIITGKGCEPWLCVANGRKIPWDDRQVVREEFAKIIKKKS